MHAALPDWRMISGQLWSRAARYAHVMGTSGTDAHSGDSGFFLHSDLDQIEEATKKHGPSRGAWWWIYVPLLRALLQNGVRSPAFLVGLGHHTRVSKNYVKRQWIHFLPDVWHGPDGIDALAHLVWMVSYNASLDEPQKLPMLLSTALLEMLNDVDHDHDGEAPVLHPLLLDFVDGKATGSFRSQVVGHTWPFITADLSYLRSALLRLDKTFAARALIQDFLSAQRRASWPSHVLDLAPTTVPRSCLSTSQINETFQSSYKTATEARRNALANLLNLVEPRFESTPCSLSLDAHLQRLPRTEKDRPSTLDQILNFNLWLHDLTIGRASDWGYLLSALSWWPSLVPGRRWSSIVVYLRPGAIDAIESVGNKSVPNWQLVPDVLASFAAASGYTAEESARADEQLSNDERVRIDDYLRGLPKTMPCVFVRCGDKCGVRFKGVSLRLPDDDGWPLVGEFIRSKQLAEPPITPAHVFQRARRIAPSSQGDALTGTDRNHLAEAEVDPGNVERRGKGGQDDPQHPLMRWSKSWLDTVESVADTKNVPIVKITTLLESSETGPQLLPCLFAVIVQICGIESSGLGDSAVKLLSHCKMFLENIKEEVDIRNARGGAVECDCGELCGCLYVEQDGTARAKFLPQINAISTHLYGYTNVSEKHAEQGASETDRATQSQAKKCRQYINKGLIKLEQIAGTVTVKRVDKATKKTQGVVTTQGAKADEVRDAAIYPNDEHTRATADLFAKHMRQHIALSANKATQYGGHVTFHELEQFATSHPVPTEREDIP